MFVKNNKSIKSYHSTDYLLKLVDMKEKSLVIVYKNATVNMLLSLVHTARRAPKFGLQEIAFYQFNKDFC